MNGANLVGNDADADRLLALGERVAEELALDCVLAEVVRELENRGIESLLLKGPALARWLYDDPSQRPYADIDLMVEPLQFDRAERCLEELGFTQDEAGRHPHERADHHESWVSPGRYRAHLELHHTLFLLTVPPELVWERLNSGGDTIEVAGTSIRVPGLVARALIVALHAAQHGAGASTPVQDLERATLSTGLETWREAVVLARQLDCLPAFAAGLALTPNGRAVARRLGIEPEGISRYLRLRMATAPDTATGIDTLIATSGVLPRLRLIGQELVPSRNFMRATYSLATRGRVGLIGAYLMRPVHLAVAFPRGLMAWLRAAIPPRLLRGRHRQRYDVVFYTPFVGWMLSSKATSPPGGAETQILILAKALAKRGDRVAVIAYGDPAELPAEVSGVQIIPRPQYNLARKRVTGKLLEALRIWRALHRAPSPTVIYRCASAELGLIGLYTKCLRRRLVFSTANVIDFNFSEVARSRRDVLLYHLGIRLADAIVVQTGEQVQLCEAAFGKRPKLIPSLSPVVELQRAEPEAFLWVGRLVWYKQPLAYVALAQAVPEAQFWMVGVPATDEDEAALAEKVAIAARATPNLELLAPRPHEQIGELMDRAVASVNTACFEGMPNVLLEAWSRGVPALVLQHDPGGVVTREKLGGFADGSADKLAVLARSLWQARGDRADLARRCVAYVATHHAPDAVSERWAAVLSLPSDEDSRQPLAFEAACAG